MTGPSHPGPNGRLTDLLARLGRVSDARVFGGTAAWVVAGGVLLQFLVLPFVVPSAHAGNGLLVRTDATMFHQMALAEASRISALGWSAWMLRPFNQVPAGLASALYVLVRPAPWVMLPLNAALFGCAVVATRRTLASLLGSRGAALAAVAPFFAFPSFVPIWGQIHKDIVTGAGLMVVLYALERARSGGGGTRWFLTLSTAVVLGMTALWLGRAYLLNVTAAAAGAHALLSFVLSPLHRRRVVMVAGVVMLCAVAGPSLPAADQRVFRRARPAAERTTPRRVVEVDRARCEPQPARGIGATVDRLLFRICLEREEFKSGYPRAGSRVDVDRPLRTAADFVRYSPRALAASVLAPLPGDWGRARSQIGRLASVLVPFEMSLTYVLLAWAACLAATRRVPRGLWPLLAFCVIYIVIHVLAIPNIGALYRMRAFAFAAIVSAALGVALTAAARANTTDRR